MACARVDVNGTDQPHIRFQTDANSTIAHLHTATDMGLQRVGFWVLKQPAYPHYESHYKPIYDAAYQWTRETEQQLLVTS
jgi:hypothetical protein